MYSSINHGVYCRVLRPHWVAKSAKDIAWYCCIMLYLFQTCLRVQERRAVLNLVATLSLWKCTAARVLARCKLLVLALFTFPFKPERILGKSVCILITHRPKYQKGAFNLHWVADYLVISGIYNSNIFIYIYIYSMFCVKRRENPLVW